MTGLEGDGSSAADPLAGPRGDPILRTRFAVSAKPVTYLRRERLTRRLDQGLRTPLTMVNGAAGAGKTLLVADWVERLGDGLPVAWFTTEAAGTGPGMFWAYLLRALHAVGVPPPAGIGFPADAHRVSPTLGARLAAEPGVRERLDSGRLGVLGVRVGSAVRAAGTVRGPRAAGLLRLTADEAGVEADTPTVPAGVDGEHVLLPVPVVCRIVPGALRVRVPRGAVGTRPGNGAPDWLRVTRLALGRHDDGPWNGGRGR